MEEGVCSRVYFGSDPVVQPCHQLECGTPTRKERARMGSGVAPDAPSCAQVLISVPIARQGGFRVLLALLKKRAFRLESDLIDWKA